MSYDEEQQKRSRVVVDTPTSRREVVQTETSRTPERSGISTGTVAALVIGAIALATILFLFLRTSPTDNANTTATTTTTTTAATTAPTAPPPTIIQQAAPPQQAPVIIQAPGQAAAPPTTVVVPPSSSSSTSTTTSPTGDTTATRSITGPADDLSIQASVDRKLQDDSTLSSLGITASVSAGKATLTGTVDSPTMKRQAERVVRAVKGVRSIDNQIVVSGSGTGNSNLTPY
ncbi:MAG: BON domain-containing protein [Pyrinomonadaceae bacterium]